MALDDMIILFVSGNMAYRHVVRNPKLQARIFLPNWFVKIVRPGREQPDDTVQMHVPCDMGKIDIKNYMEAIYGIKVAKVHTRIQAGKVKSYTDRYNRILTRKTPDYKVAYVMLAEGTFKFPQMFPESGPSEIVEREDDDLTAVKESQPQASTNQTPNKWFDI